MSSIPPPPITVNAFVNGICGPSRYCRDYTFKYIKENIDTDPKWKKNTGLIIMSEAQQYVKKFDFGHHPSLNNSKNSIPAKIFEGIKAYFFNNSPLDGAHSRLKPFAVPANRVSFVDLDTYEIVFPDGRVEPFRYSGIDAAEAGENYKLWNIGDYTYLLWSKSYNLNADPRLINQMIKDRSRYGGLLGSAAAQGLQMWAAEKNIPITTWPAFDRVSSSPEGCNTVTRADKYGRNMGVPSLGAPNDQRPLIAEFIAEGLPKIMRALGTQLYNFYRTGESPGVKPGWWKSPKNPASLSDAGKAFLDHIKGQRNPAAKEIWHALSPDTLPVPSEIFSEENCKKIAKMWLQFTSLHPQYRNDIQTMAAFVGLAWAYPKYTNPLTPTLLAAERVSMGILEDGSRAGSKPLGLNEDIIFSYGRPNSNYSLLYKEYGPELADYRDLLPPDCCEVLKKSGKDTYNHCR